MTFIKAPTTEGEKKECDGCKVELIARLTDYKGRFPDKLQWQTKDERKAHYTKEGLCKDLTPEQAENEASATVFKPNTSDNIPEATIDPESLDEQGKEIFENLLLLYKIDKMTINYLGKDAQVQKIGLWTKLVFQAMSKK